ELNRAYLLFQIGPLTSDESVPSQIAARYDRWQATSRFPRMIKDLYVAIQAGDAVTLKRFTPATRVLEPADWPETLAAVRAQLAHSPIASVWPDAPALVVSAPFLFVNAIADRPVPDGPVPLPAEMSYAVLLLDGNYIRAEVLPSLAQHHFQGTAGGSGYELAVVPTAGSGSIYHSVDGFNPKADPKPDATAAASGDLFPLPPRDFGALVSEIRRFAFFPGRTGYANATAKTVIRHTITAPPDDAIRYENHSGPVSIFVQKGRSGVSTTV